MSKVETIGNIIDVAEYEETKVIFFRSLSKKEQEDYLICCDEEARQELINNEDAVIPKPITIVLNNHDN